MRVLGGVDVLYTRAHGPRRAADVGLGNFPDGGVAPRVGDYLRRADFVCGEPYPADGGRRGGRRRRSGPLFS